MSFIILRSSAPIPQAQREHAVRSLLSRYGTVGGILIARRDNSDASWDAAVDMRSGQDEAIEALNDGELEGHPVRLCHASPLVDKGVLRALAEAARTM